MLVLDVESCWYLWEQSVTESVVGVDEDDERVVEVKDGKSDEEGAISCVNQRFGAQIQDGKCRLISKIPKGSES
jgi:hypothetical protein